MPKIIIEMDDELFRELLERRTGLFDQEAEMFTSYQTFDDPCAACPNNRPGRVCNCTLGGSKITC